MRLAWVLAASFPPEWQHTAMGCANDGRLAQSVSSMSGDIQQHQVHCLFRQQTRVPTGVHPPVQLSPIPLLRAIVCTLLNWFRRKLRISVAMLTITPPNPVTVLFLRGTTTNQTFVPCGERGYPNRAQAAPHGYFLLGRSCAATLMRPLGSLSFFFQTENPSFFTAIL